MKIRKKSRKKRKRKVERKWSEMLCLSIYLLFFLLHFLLLDLCLFVDFVLFGVMMIKKKEEIIIRIMRGSVTLFVQCVFDFSLHLRFFFVHSFSHLFLMFSHHVWCFRILRNDQTDVLFVFQSHSYSRPQNLIWSEVFSFKDHVIMSIHQSEKSTRSHRFYGFLFTLKSLIRISSNNFKTRQSINWSFTQTHFVSFCFRYSFRFIFFSFFFLFSKNPTIK